MKRNKIPIVYAPKVISLYKREYAIATLLFIQQLYNYEADVICVDFSQTEQITAAAELALLAHIHYIQLFKQNAGCFQFNCKRSPIYKSHFIQEGYLKRLKSMAKEFELGKAFQNEALVKIGKVAHFAECRARNLLDIAEFAEETIAKMIAENPLANMQSVEQFFRSLKTAISEVLLNIKNHAYEDGSQPVISSDVFDIYVEKPWWQMFWYSPNSRQITFIIYDLGLGVTNSYTEQATQKRSKDQYASVKDIFTEALSEGKSRFIGGGRGNGLSNVVKIAQENFNTSLVILSGEIAYIVQKGQSSFLDLEGNSVPGTLVEWVFELPQWS